MRLIDADAFIASLNEYIDKPMTAGLCATLVEMFPTAYDVERVVAELEGLPTKGIDRYKGGSFGKWEGTDYFIDKHKTIDIVRKGGVHG